jgi:hypothetical protein
VLGSQCHHHGELRYTLFSAVFTFQNLLVCSHSFDHSSAIPGLLEKLESYWLSDLMDHIYHSNIVTSSY